MSNRTVSQPLTERHLNRISDGVSTVTERCLNRNTERCLNRELTVETPLKVGLFRLEGCKVGFRSFDFTDETGRLVRACSALLASGGVVIQAKNSRTLKLKGLGA
jgi:hypothetical protein